MNADASSAPKSTDGALPSQRGPALTLRRGATVQPAYGRAGRLEHVLLDPQAHEVSDLVVAFQDKQWLVPIAAVAGVQGDCIKLRGARYEYETAPFRRAVFQRDGFQVAPRERSGTARHSGAPLLDATDTAVRIATVVPAEAEQRVSSKRPYHLDLREERLRVTKQSETAGRLRVSRRTVERIRTIEVAVREEVAVLELAASVSGEPVVLGNVTLHPGRPVELTLITERIHISKEPVALADVSVDKQVVQRQERVQETLRREELALDDPSGLAVQRLASPAGGVIRNGTGPAARRPRPGTGPAARPPRANRREGVGAAVPGFARALAVSASLVALLFSLGAAAGKPSTSSGSGRSSHDARRLS